jgi:hypothetical protein
MVQNILFHFCVLRALSSPSSSFLCRPGEMLVSTFQLLSFINMLRVASSLCAFWYSKVDNAPQNCGGNFAWAPTRLGPVANCLFSGKFRFFGLLVSTWSFDASILKLVARRKDNLVRSSRLHFSVLGGPSGNISISTSLFMLLA